MRILTLSDLYPPFNPGGAQEVARRLTAGYQEEGHEVAVITTHDPESQTVTSFEGIEIFSVAQKAGLRYLEKGFENEVTTSKIVSLIESFRPDVIHAHNSHSALGWGWITLAKEKKIKTCITFHDHMTVSQGKLIPPEEAQPGDVIEQPFIRELRRYKRSYIIGRRKKIIEALKNVDVLTAVSQDLANQLTGNGLPEMKVILNGADVEDQGEIQWSAEPTLLYLSRPTAEKGLYALMQAIEQCKYQFKVIVAGKVSEEKKKYCKSLAPNASIDFSGWVSGEEKKKMIEKSWVVCNLSIYPDPCPLTNYEAMAGARAVLGTLWGGSSEVLRNGEEAWLVDPRNISQIVKALNQIHNYPPEVTRRGQIAYDSVKKKFQWKDVVRRYLNLITS